jgi:hypothetical protein
MADLLYPFNNDNIGGSDISAPALKPRRGTNVNALPVSGPVTEKLKPIQGQKSVPGTDLEKPLYNSRIIITYVEYLQTRHPGIIIDSILEYAGMTRYEVEDPGHWFNQNQTDRFHDIIVTMTGNANIARDAGRFTASCKRIGPAIQYAMGLINLTSVYLMVGKLVRTLSRGAVMKAKKLGTNKVEIISTPKSGTAEQNYQCQNRIGTLESIAQIFIHKFAQIEHPDCFHRGDDCCRYLISWEKTPFLIWKQISHGALLCGLHIVPVVSAYRAS